MSSLEQDWDAAAADAGISHVDVTLYPLVASGQHGASHYQPGYTPQAWDDEFAYSTSDLETLRATQESHVVVVASDLLDPKRLLVLRHEAEHVAQYEFSPQAAEFAFRLAVALPHDAGWGWLYYAMPHERDADAAATRLRESADILASSSDLEGADRFLYAAPWQPPDPESLPVRLLAFSLFYVDGFDLACTSSQFWHYVDPEVLIEGMVPGGVQARAALRDLLAGRVEGLADPDLTLDRWNRMSRPEQNELTDALRAQVLVMEAEGVALIRAELNR